MIVERVLVGGSTKEFGNVGVIAESHYTSPCTCLGQMLRPEEAIILRCSMFSTIFVGDFSLGSSIALCIRALKLGLFFGLALAFRG